MKKVTTHLLSWSLCFLGGLGFLEAQEKQAYPAADKICRTAEVMDELYRSNPDALMEQEAREVFTQDYVRNYQPKAAVAKGQEVNLVKYRIPVVFHVYGGASHTFWGKTVTKAKIDAALADLNKDFQALNDDYGQVNNAFSGTKSVMDISFELALKKKDGSVTDGVDWKTTTGAGYGGTNMNAQIAADAWDCQMYMNVYIVADLYNDGGSTNSGVAWYPNTSMTTANTARVVYNGQYLGPNTDKEFRSVLTHEFGHWLNLRHTFDGNSCTGTGDGVADTPSHTSTSLGCHPSQTSTQPQECSHLVNVENYMDYNGAYSCQRMFSLGQVTRMNAALELLDITRNPLWQTANLCATGLITCGTDIAEPVVISSTDVYPNPGNGDVNFDMNVIKSGEYKMVVTDVLGNVISSHTEHIAGFYSSKLELSDRPSGIYLLSVYDSNNIVRSAAKIVRQ